jgi:hypothetical protein
LLLGQRQAEVRGDDGDRIPEHRILDAEQLLDLGPPPLALGSCLPEPLWRASLRRWLATDSLHTVEGVHVLAPPVITDQKLSVAEVARRLGVGEGLLHAWKKVVAK